MTNHILGGFNTRRKKMYVIFKLKAKNLSKCRKSLKKVPINWTNFFLSCVKLLSASKQLPRTN